MLNDSENNVRYAINNPLSYCYPIIYVYTIPDADHTGKVKIGLTHGWFNLSSSQIHDNNQLIQDFANARIDEQTGTASVRHYLLYCTIAKTKSGKDFSDKDVHYVLKRNNKFPVDFKTIGIKGGKEWFAISLKEAIDAINSVRNETTVLISSNTSANIILRPSQQESVDKALNCFRTSNQFLWACKMRFGKTFSALKLITSSFNSHLNFNHVCIFTNRPGVRKQWLDDFTTLGMEQEGYIFYAKDNGQPLIDKNNKEINAINLNKKAIVFYSMQDLKGSEKFNKNELAINASWDLIIVDEADEGTTSILGEKLINKLKNASPTAKWLYLSGTPYRILNQFNKDEVYTWNYTNEQQAKQKLQDELINYYEDLPQLRLYLINLQNDLKLNEQAYADKTDEYFSFEEFFKCTKDEHNEDHFVNEAIVKQFLDLLVNQENKQYPFSNDEYRQYFNHTFWYLPNVAACKALAKLLNKHPVFGSFGIVDVSGNNEDANTAQLAVENAIKTYKHTITLSCGRLTRGITIPQWTAILYLAGGSSTSASQYMQTIFRVQSPYKDKISGKIKEVGYVFDFAPQRALVMQQTVAKNQAKLNDKESIEKILETNLTYLPVITNKDNLFVAYDANTLINQIEENNIRIICDSGFLSPKLIKSSVLDELSSKEADILKQIGKELGESKLVKNKINLNDNHLNDSSTKSAKTSKLLTKEEKDKKNQRKELLSALLAIATRFPLLIFGAYNPQDNIHLDLITNDIDDESWAEFMPPTVTKERFNELAKCFKEDLFNACARKILLCLKNAQESPIKERIIKITNLFNTFQNPEKEIVLTPWKVINMHLGTCIGGWNFFTNDYSKECEPHFIDLVNITKNIYAKNHQVLDIYSKTGLYSLYNAFNFFQLYKQELETNNIPFTEELIWQQVIEHNVFALCQTKMAKTITTRTLVGFNQHIKPNIYLQEDLIEKLNNNAFQTVKDTMAIKTKDNRTIHFDAIVGNPPYAKLDSTSNSISHTPIYPKFVELAINLNPTYFSYIIPKTWEGHKQGKGLEDFNKLMLKDGYVNAIYNIDDASNLFNNVQIGGGVCFFLAKGTPTPNLIPNIYTNSLVIPNTVATKQPNFVQTYTSVFAHYDPKKNEYYDQHQVIFLNKEVKSIFDKVFPKNHQITTCETIVESRNPYGITSNCFDLDIKNKTNLFHDKPTKNNVAVYGTINRTKRTVLYTNPQNLKDNPSLNEYKCLIGKGYGMVNCYPTHTVIAKPIFASPHEACTETFLEVGANPNQEYVKRIYIYIYSKFFRLFLSIKRNNPNISKFAFEYIPLIDLNDSHIPWSEIKDDYHQLDQYLYKYFDLNQDQINFIENNIKDF